VLYTHCSPGSGFVILDTLPEFTWVRARRFPSRHSVCATYMSRDYSDDGEAATNAVRCGEGKCERSGGWRPGSVTRLVQYQAITTLGRPMRG
jgi:hypothetical protein